MDCLVLRWESADEKRNLYSLRNDDDVSYYIFCRDAGKSELCKYDVNAAHVNHISD